MSRLFRQATVLAVLGLAALVSACGDDDDTTVFDAPISSADARIVDAGSTADAAAATVYNITLTKDAEKPAVCSMAGANATGTAMVTVSADNSSITVHVTYSGLSGGNVATAGHIHYGGVNDAKGVVLPFTAAGTNVPNPFDKVFHASDYIVATGAPATFAEFVTLLKSGGAYVNLHVSATCPNGEVRGQIVNTP